MVLDPQVVGGPGRLIYFGGDMTAKSCAMKAKKSLKNLGVVRHKFNTLVSLRDVLKIDLPLTNLGLAARTARQIAIVADGLSRSARLLAEDLDNSDC